MILVIAEQRDGALNRASWEAVAAAQQLAAGQPVAVAIAGGDVARRGGRDRGGRRRRGHHDHRAALLPLHRRRLGRRASRGSSTPVKPSFVLLPHTYQTRDFAPALAARSTARSSPIARRSRPGRPVRCSRGRCSRASWPPTSGRWATRRAWSPCRLALTAPTRPGAAHRPRPCAPSTSRSTPPRFARCPRRRSAKRGRPSTSRRPSASSPSAAASRGGAPAARAGAGRRARRRGRRVAADLRRGLAADGAPDRQLRPDRRAEALRRGRHLRRHPARRRHEGRAHDRRHQQGRRGADLRGGRLRHTSGTCSSSCPP